MGDWAKLPSAPHPGQGLPKSRTAASRQVVVDASDQAQARRQSLATAGREQAASRRATLHQQYNATPNFTQRGQIGKGLRSLIMGTKKVVPLPERAIPSFAVKGGWRDARLDAREYAASDRGRFRAGVSKAEEKQPKASQGRMAAGMVFPGAHGAIAGKKGRKLRAAASEYVPAVALGAPGMAGSMMAARAGKPGLAAAAQAAGYAGNYLGAGLGVRHAQARGHYKPEKVAKTRSFDPEHRRQQKLGAATAVLGLGGAAAAVHGGRNIAATTKTARQITGVSTKTAGNQAQMTIKNARLRQALRSGVHANKKDLALLGGGTAAIGGGGAVQVHANSRRGKAWD